MAASVLLDLQRRDIVAAMTQPYGSFSSSANQTVAIINTAYAIAFNTNDIVSGITHSTVTNNSRIQIDMDGVYHIVVSAIADLASGTNKHINLWLRIGGSTTVANSNTKVQVLGTIETTLAVALLYSFTAGQYFELMYSADDTNMRLLATAAAAPAPACPSVICTVTRISA